MEWQAWLSDLSQSRCVLVELTHSAGALYLATMPYQSGQNDDPANTAYDDVITELPEISRDESQSVSLGDLEFHTPEAGQLIQYQWDKVVIYLGSPDWPKADFKQISASRIERVMRSAVDRARVEFNDDNYALADVLPNPQLYSEPEGTIIPLIVGNPVNVKPLNTFPALLEYAVGTYGVGDPLVTVDSVRDNGVPVTFTALDNGRFRLNSPPAGEVTARYSAGSAGLFEVLTELVAGEGVALLAGKGFDVALSGLNVGAVATEGTTYRELIDTLTMGLNVSVQYAPDGALEVVYYGLDRDPDAVITEDDIVAGSVEHTDTLPVVSGITIKYAQNFAVLSSIAGAAESDADAVALQSTYQSYRLGNPDSLIENELIIETALSDLASAQLIAARLLGLRAVARYAYRFELFTAGIALRDGYLLDLQHAGWGLSGPALVTKVEYTVGANRVQIEVLM